MGTLGSLAEELEKLLVAAPVLPSEVLRSEGALLQWYFLFMSHLVF